jgi:molybdopterin synthase catalytic subunit
VVTPAQGDDWLELTTGPIPISTAYEWCVLPRCGAVVLFSGTVRDHAEGRSGVTHLEYEAYEAQVRPRFEAIVAELRLRWPETGRIAMLHRIGRLELAESSVVVVVSAPHRPEAFAAARFGIDSLKASVPIWKRESWSDGEAWALGAHELVDASDVSSEHAPSDPAPAAPVASEPA